MKCDNREIPSYLHWNNRIAYSEKEYFYFHKLYRLKKRGNPIEIPANWVTAISCKWSKVIKRKHILLQPEKVIGDDYDYAFVREIKNYKREVTLSIDHEFKGLHLITCVLTHSPIPCDYSHSEILIRHRIYRDNEIEPFFDETYSHEAWENETALLKKQKSTFFKELKKDFRVDMIKLISRPSQTNIIKQDIKAIVGLF